jgi:hypothetical protein
LKMLLPLAKLYFQLLSRYGQSLGQLQNWSFLRKDARRPIAQRGLAPV